MSQQSLIARRPAAAARGPMATPSPLQRALRRGLMSRLEGLRSGAIRLHDGLGVAVLGDPNGPLGTVDLFVHDPVFWRRVAFGGDVGAGEAYVAGSWSASDVVALLRMFVRDRDVMLDVDGSPWSLPRRALLKLGQWLRRNSRGGSRRNIHDHYDLGDELFAHFLDPSMTYSSAWFEYQGQPLEKAQQAKLRRLCELVDLEMDDRLLEIGTGWGSFARYAAGRFGARVTTATISRNQLARARQRIADAGLDERVACVLSDYRDLEGVFDKVVSCEMIEAVGAKYLPTYLRVCDERLRPGGLLGLQAITIADQHYRDSLQAPDYIKCHVFPGSFIPSVSAIVDAATRHTDLRLERLEQFGAHYATTLSQWRDTVLRQPEPFLARGGPSMLRAWDYYFAYCEAGFREGNISVSHLRFRKAGGAPRG